MRIDIKALILDVARLRARASSAEAYNILDDVISVLVKAEAAGVEAHEPKPREGGQ